ncbi:hypothetical protein ACFY64_34950 [Streptomyces collinus]|uniref:hypothetical protein n=1 Tax=Streptomyces TaxID=1883 RepID=UPI0035DF6FC8
MSDPSQGLIMSRASHRSQAPSHVHMACMASSNRSHCRSAAACAATPWSQTVT